MKHFSILLLIILLCPISNNAQNQAFIDSLTSAAQTQKDTRKLFDIYYKLAATTIDNNLTQSISYAETANEIAKQNKYPELITKSYLILASAYLEAGYLDDAQYAAEYSLNQALKNDNYLYQYFAYRNMGAIFRRKANYDSALLSYMSCLKVTEDHLGDNYVIIAYTGLGAYYATLGNLDKAEDWHKKALELSVKINDSVEIASANNNLGIVNRDRGDYKKALEHYNISRAIYLARNNTSDIAFIYNDLGAIYSKSGVLDSGEFFLKKSIEMREQMNELIELPYTYNYLGENYERKGDLRNAEQYIKKALSLAIDIKNNKQHYEALESLSDFYARNKIYDSAYQYLQLHKSFRDSIRQLDNQQLIADLNARYETEKKEKKIQEQQFELSRKNYFLAGGAVLLLSVLLLGLSWYKRYQLKQKAALQAAILKQQELATKAIIEAEENERQRIAGDLHDGVGQMISAAKINLSTVSSDIIFTNDKQKQRFENALKLVDDSCTEVRTVSHNIMPNALLRNSLAAAVRNFISKIDQHVLKINLHAEGLNEKLDENIEIMLYRVIQECVNNVIKHAHANMLDISLIKDDKEICVTIEDNGVGFDVKEKHKLEGIGLKNISSRINYLKGNVEWDSAHGRGTVVSIHIPAHPHT